MTPEWLSSLTGEWQIWWVVWYCPRSCEKSFSSLWWVSTKAPIAKLALGHCLSKKRNFDAVEGVLALRPAQFHNKMLSDPITSGDFENGKTRATC